MKAIVHHGPMGFPGLKVQEMEEREPGTGEVKIRLKISGLNHRDIWMLHRPRESQEPVILGSDGAGVVESVGSGVDTVMVGEEVVINPSLGWPLKSEAPPEGFQILGVPSSGTFAESIIISAQNVEKKPAYLTWQEAGVFPLAALTAYRALFTKGQLQTGEHVLIPGIGSGVATFLLMMAKAAGAKVTVTSRSEEKRQRALELGADAAISSDGDWAAQMNGEKADLVVDSVGLATFNKAVGQLRPDGRIVTFGNTTGDEVTISLRQFFFLAQLKLLGTTMGSTEEFREMLRFVEKHQIRPVIDQVYPLGDALSAFRRMDEGQQFGKIGFVNE